MVVSVNGQHGLLALRHAILVFENEIANVIHQYHNMVVTGVRVRDMGQNVAKSRIVQVTIPSSVCSYVPFTAPAKSPLTLHYNRTPYGNQLKLIRLVC